jgi:hypothetical protein
MPASYDAPVTVSTNWAWKKVKISQRRNGQLAESPKAPFWWRFPRRNPREPIQWRIKLRGGPEGWVEIHARGSIGRYPGTTCIYDILMDVNNSH